MHRDLSGSQFISPRRSDPGQQHIIRRSTPHTGRLVCFCGRTSSSSIIAKALQDEHLRIVCPHIGKCSGCTVLGPVTSTPALASAVRYFADEHGRQLSVSNGPVHGWRQRARLAVRGRRGALQVGLFRAGTHAVLDIPRCAVHHPQISVAAVAVKVAAEELGIEPYNEGGSNGLLRYLQLTAAGQGDTAPVQVSLQSPAGTCNSNAILLIIIILSMLHYAQTLPSCLVKVCDK